MDGRDQHPIGLAIRADIEIVAAAIDEADLLVKRDGAWIVFPDAEPESLTFNSPCGCVNRLHEALRKAVTVAGRST